jgi:predicted phage baseplate assembly protein
MMAAGRFGKPLAGNIGADVLWHVVTGVAGVKSVRNPLPASGGVAPLSPTAIRIEAPQAFRIQQRAVTEADWAEVAQRQAEVSRALARIRWTGAWRTAFVYVDRKGGLPVETDKSFRSRMLTHLDRYRLAGVDLALRGPVPVSLDITLKLCVCPGYLRADVLRGVLHRLTAGAMDDGRPGFFHPDNFTFGSSLYLSVLIGAVMEVPGVASVEPVRFQRWAKAAVNELADGVIHAGEFEVLRLDNDPNFPENGRLVIDLQGGA